MRFLEENMIFITSSLLLVGLFGGVNLIKNIPRQNQVNTSQIPVTDTSNTSVTGTEVINLISESAPTIPEQVTPTPTPTPTPTVTPTPAPTLTPPVTNPFRPRFDDEFDD